MPNNVTSINLKWDLEDEAPSGDSQTRQSTLIHGDRYLMELVRQSLREVNVEISDRISCKLAAFDVSFENMKTRISLLSEKMVELDRKLKTNELANLKNETKIVRLYSLRVSSRNI